MPGTPYTGPDMRSVILTEQEHRIALNCLNLNANHENAALRKKLQLSLDRIKRHDDYPEKYPDE